MICCSFVFEPGEYDDDFHRLDAQIDAFARGLDGFVRVDRWFSDDRRFQNSMYFFADYRAVKELANYPQHLVAKSDVDRWYRSYRVDVFEQKTSYGSATTQPETTAPNPAQDHA
ncbi:MAG: hypothetical protein RL431_672 [Actinomycetota bacterium]|jgi:hypothetical protein